MTLSALGLPAAAPATIDPAAPALRLQWVFSAPITLTAPLEQGQVDGKLMRFVPVTGGRVHDPRLNGTVLKGGGDWQAIHSNSLTEVDVRYSLHAADGTVIAIVNTGVRAVSAAVSDQIATSGLVRMQALSLSVSVCANVTGQTGPAGPGYAAAG